MRRARFATAPATEPAGAMCVRHCRALSTTPRISNTILKCCPVRPLFVEAEVVVAVRQVAARLASSTLVNEVERILGQVDAAPMSFARAPERLYACLPRSC
jgi:hypothetical protein